VRRQAVQGDGAGRRALQQRVVEAVRRERRAARVGGVLVAHADPDVGVDGMRPGDRLGRVARQQRAGAVAGQLVALRRRDRHLDAGDRADERQRPRDVVAVADVGEPQSLQAAELLAQGHEVGERLTGVMAGREHVEHGHVRRGRELLEHRVGAGAHADRRDVARQHAGRVADGLAAGEVQLVAAQHDRLAAELEDPGLERQPRARRVLLEDQGDAAALERARRQRRGLQHGGAVQQREQLVAVELGSREQMARQVGQSMVM
jgi:hypothetical protein